VGRIARIDETGLQPDEGKKAGKEEGSCTEFHSWEGIEGLRKRFVQ